MASLSAPSTLAIVFSVLVLWVLYRPGNSRRELQLPVETPAPGPNGIFEAVQENYKKYPNTPYLLNIARPIVILPAKCIDDVKYLPEEKASLYDEVHIDLSQAVTGIGGGGDSPESIPTVRIDLTRRLNSAVDAMADELRYAMSTEFGADDKATEWTTCALHPKISTVVALVNWRIFLGRPLSRSTEWLTHALGYSIDVMRARHALNKYPYYLRLVIGRFLPEVRRLKWHVAHGAKLLMPIVEQLVSSKRQQDVKSLSSQCDSSPEPEVLVADDEFQDQQGTFCSWLLKYAVGSRDSASILISNLLALSFVSTHTIGYGISRALFDLAARPEYIEQLRDEIEQALQEDGFDLDANGQRNLRKTTYVKLRKMDSFLKESQRLFPSKFVSMVRISRAPISLSTGHQLPAGTRFGIPVYAVHTTSAADNKTGSLETKDAHTEETPLSEFDGLRYYRLRQVPGNDTKHQFATTSNDSLAFGLGVHCCPGRFYASMVVKVIFVELLRFWDIRIPGDETANGGSPPKIKFMDFSIGADPKELIEIRRRSVQG